MFIKVLNYDDNGTDEITLNSVFHVERCTEEDKGGQTRILANRFRSEANKFTMGWFRSPHSPQRVRQAIKLFAGFLAGERQSLLDLPMSTTPLSNTQQVSSWELDLSDAKGIRFIETTANFDSNGNLQLDDGSSITVERATPSKASIHTPHL